MKNKVRFCGRCFGEDTMLICCECLRILKEEEIDKKNTEVKQVIEDLNEVDFKGEMEGKVILGSKKELLQKLGLNAKEDKEVNKNE